MHIDTDSYGSLAIVYVISAIILVLVWKFIDCKMISLPITILTLVFCIWQTAFFRVPDREHAGNDKEISSVADGKVVIIEKVYEPIYLKRECIQVSVYMDFFDVHANFWPMTGEVTFYKYFPGEHFLAFKPKASEENEHSCTAMKNADGTEILFKQLAGTFARRIVCYSEPGLKTKAGEQCGIIKFGSRIDMYLPLDADIKVKLGEQVRACETIIATL